MDCGKAREQIYRYGGRHTASAPSPSELLHAKDHVDQCAVCKEFFASEDGIKALVRDRIAGEPATAELRERVLSRIAEQRRVRHKTKKWLGLIAAFVALVLVVTTFWNKSGPKPAVAVPDFLIEEHVHNLGGPIDISSAETNAIESWLRQRVDFSFHLPALSDPAIAGGRICQVRGRRAALVHYEFRQNKASLFILDGRGLDLPESRLIPLDGKRCLVESAKGYNVVSWKERGLLYGLVSDANSAELLRMAASF